MDTQKQKLEQAKKNLLSFRNNLTRFIETLINAFPEEFDEKEVKEHCDILKQYQVEDINEPKALNKFKKLNTFIYLTRYRYTMEPYIKDFLSMDLELFTDKKYKIPSRALEGFDIDFRRIWKIKDITDQHKKTILMYFGLLYKWSDKTTEVFSVSKKNEKIIEQRKKVRKIQRKKMKDMIYRMLGDNGKNETIEVIIEDVLDEFERSKNKIFSGMQSGNINPNDIKAIIQKLYEKLSEKYEEGKLKDEELKDSAKALYKNIMENDEMNMKDQFSEIMKVMNLDNLDMTNPETMAEIEKAMKDPNILKDNPKLEEQVDKFRKFMEEKIKPDDEVKGKDSIIEEEEEEEDGSDSE